MPDLDYLWSGSQIILTAILIILTYLYVRDTRRSVISTKVDYLSKVYDRKCETIHTCLMGATSSTGDAKLHFASILKRENELNKEILDLYLASVDEYDKEFKLKGKFSHAIRNTFAQSEEERNTWGNLLKEKLEH